METLEERKAKRFQFMKALYGMTGGRANYGGNKYLIGSAFGFDREETDSIVAYLEGEHLVATHMTLLELDKEVVYLQHAGLIEVERALSEPKQPTQHFPAITNIIHVEKMENSQIQQGTHGSQQTGTFNLTQDVEGLKSLVAKIKAELPKVSELSSDARQEVACYVTAMEQNLSLAKPNDTFLRESLKSLRSVLEKASGSVVGAGILLTIKSYLQSRGIQLPL